MPGAYAHITLVNLASEPARLEAAGLPDAAIGALLSWFKYCELGAVSPDYPYLCLDGAQHPWADHMHYERVGATLAAGVRAVRAQGDETQRQRAFAWLLGYAAHVVTDMTIHPIVERKVGPYAENKTAHRVCEMNQDAYIFRRLDLGEIGLAEHLGSGIATCVDAADPQRPDPAVTTTWRQMLQAAFPAVCAALPPDFAAWHRGFALMVDKIAEEGNHLLPLARHIAVKCGLTYPASHDVDRQYIDQLDTPLGPRSYDEVFNAAIANVLATWHDLAADLYGDSAGPLAQLAGQEWNLDTGRRQGGEYVYWA